jgi:cysteine desulfurase
MTRPIYLDYAATTPIDPAVVAAMLPWLADKFGNPHSPHLWGYEADAAVEIARGQVAAVLGADPSTVAFTGGATEAVNWALKGMMTASEQTRRRLVTLATEHSCVLATARWLESIGCALTIVGVGADGVVDLDALNAAMGDDVALVSAMLVNNETGVIQPVARIADLVHAHGALMHCDAAQGFGKVDCTALGVDLLSLTAHKIYGPKGVGALYRRPGIALTPLLHGGGQEDGRSGTLSPALCVGLGTAAAIAGERMAADAAHVRALWDRLLGGLDVPVRVNGSLDQRWFGTANLGFPGVDPVRLFAAVRELAISTGSACSSAGGRPSHVLAAMAGALPGLRIGWGRFTTEAEIDTAAAVLTAAARRLGSIAA